MYLIVLGPAGCGKSLLTGSFGSYLQREGYTVKFMNLDPGVLGIPYKPDFDVRDKFTVEEIMRREGLGPNGAIMRAMDKLSDIQLPGFEADFVLVDTPGQLEPFIFREAGPRIIERLRDCCSIFIFDGAVSTRNLPSLYLYSLVTRYALNVEAINILNKVDLLSVEGVEEWRASLVTPELQPKTLEGLKGEIDFEISNMIKKYLPPQRIPFISAKTGLGFDELLAIIKETKCACGDLT